MTIHRFEFDEKSHTYTMDGKRLPSVTEIIRDVLPSKQWGTDWHMERGTQIHVAAKLIAEGQTPIVDPQIEGHVDGIMAFHRKEVKGVVAAELPVFCTKTLYAGTLDLIADLSMIGLAVVDYKASGCEYRTALQMCAYALAYGDKSIKWGVMVTLPGDGKYKINVVKLAEFVNEWRVVRSVYGMRQRLGVNKSVTVAAPAAGDA
jgi:hypothetical protein